MAPEKQLEDKIDDIMVMIDTIEQKIKRKVEERENIGMKKISGKKNHQLHMLIDKNLYNKLVNGANKEGISLSEQCRRKLEGSSQLDRIEGKLDRVFANKF